MVYNCGICKKDFYSNENCYYVVQGKIADDGTFVRNPNPVAMIICGECAKHRLFGKYQRR